MGKPSDELKAAHTTDAIAERIAAATDHNYVGDTVLGAVDGAITTFAIVSGVAGAGLSTAVALVLGLANVLADGFSMAVGNFLKSRADAEAIARVRRMEERHIDKIPEGEREEIRQIFAAKGFEVEILEEIVRVITADRRRWVDTMLTDEWGLPLATPSPLKAGSTTFAAFLVAGLVPLAPLLFAAWLEPEQTFAASAVATGLAFLAIGCYRGRIVGQSMTRTALETLAIGSVAATIAYGVGAWLRDVVGV